GDHRRYRSGCSTDCSFVENLLRLHSVQQASQKHSNIHRVPVNSNDPNESTDGGVQNSKSAQAGQSHVQDLPPVMHVVKQLSHTPRQGGGQGPYTATRISLD